MYLMSKDVFGTWIKFWTLWQVKLLHRVSLRNSNMRKHQLLTNYKNILLTTCRWHTGGLSSVFRVANFSIHHTFNHHIIAHICGHFYPWWIICLWWFDLFIKGIIFQPISSKLSSTGNLDFYKCTAWGTMSRFLLLRG